MDTNSHTSLHKMAMASVVVVVISTLSGCSHQVAASLSQPPAATPAVTGNPQDPIANNPPPGQPNHMSPEMQAQIEHYRSLGPTR